jgi:hypothetical protein
MDLASLIVGLCNVACGLVFALLGSILAAVRIPRGKWFGFRVGNALASDENWERVNRFGGQRLVVWGIPLILAGVICVFLAFPPPDSWMAPIGLLPIFVFVMVPIIETTVYARALPPAGTDKGASGHPEVVAPTR